MNIIIPIGGYGKRFSDFGYNMPKPLINSLGKPIIIRCLGSLNVGYNDTIYIPYRHELDKYNFKDIVEKEFTHNFKFIPINFDTRGAAETVLIAINSIPSNQLNDLTIVVDSDNIYNDDIINDLKTINDTTIFYFEDKNTKPIFSYIKINENFVLDIKEKNKISDYACLGAYGFKNSNLLKEYIVKIINDNDKTNNEFYVSSIYKKMILNGLGVKHKICYDYVCLGTPEQLRIFSSNINNDEKLRFCFDLDNTLVTFPKIKNDYSTVEPITKNINFLRFLKRNGHEIIIHTARRMKTHKGDIDKVINDIKFVTIKTLEILDIPYDELYFGKPYANYYIDDLAIKSYDDLDKELGFYEIHPETRKHNKIEILNDKIIKTSEDIKGEKYWYENIPKNIEHMFPKLINTDDESITISKINGLPISYLNINKILTVNIIKSVLISLEEIHNSSDLLIDIDIYDNYTKKMNYRVENYDFSSYKNFKVILNEINNHFESYVKNKRGKIGVIHGDPVFTNILIDNFDTLKFIDMRGKVGEFLTIYGDKLYDYAKVYQSLIGYDFILMDKEIDYEYVTNNVLIFEKYIIEKFGVETLNDIKWITKSLIISLIPIHNNDKCHKFYDLITNIN
jgi:capsule biosynthesis phosphatase